MKEEMFGTGKLTRKEIVRRRRTSTEKRKIIQTGTAGFEKVADDLTCSMSLWQGAGGSPIVLRKCDVQYTNKYSHSHCMIVKEESV